MNSAQIAIVLAGTLLPAAFVLFAISVTRRPNPSEHHDGLSAAIQRLQHEWHTAETPRSPSQRQS